MKRQREHSQDILDKLEEARKNKQDIGVDYKKSSVKMGLMLTMDVYIRTTVLLLKLLKGWNIR